MASACVLLLERFFRVFVIGGGRAGSGGERATPRPASATDPAPFSTRRRVAGKRSVRGCHREISHEVSPPAPPHRVCRKSTIALISCSVKIRVSAERRHHGLRVALVSSVRIATRSLRSGYLLLMSFKRRPDAAGKVAALDPWQLRQLPLLRSKASFWPSAAGLRVRGRQHRAAERQGQCQRRDHNVARARSERRGFGRTGSEKVGFKAFPVGFFVLPRI